MDAYPSGSLDVNVPLLAVSGLSPNPTSPLLTDAELRERGILVRSELPPIDTREARAILRYIQDADASGLPWQPRDSSKKYRFRIRPIGREFLLPPRRARLPDELDAPSSAFVLHSPFSPLSPGSTLYPDGLIDSRWLHKHQDLIPSVCLCFYTLTSDPTLATLHDSQLKTDIIAVKNAIAQSGYRTRLAVVILSDQSPTTITQFQERLENIRRGTSLDPKASLFVLPTRRTAYELETAVEQVLSAVFDQALDYYRDLGRHARKKKGRGIAPQPTVPPTSGTSHTLSLQGWNVRYDFKSAVFAEFRQEFDVALRSYEQAYETLLGADVLETIPAWNPRFNDARLLADILAIQTLKCLFLGGQSTAAVRRWQAHSDQISDLVDRKGRGTHNYGWKAWQARWCTVMANLIEKADFPELKPGTSLLFRPPEKSLSAERLQPWELLHHPGYWYRAAARHLLDRRTLAKSMPEDDRKPPDGPLQAGVSRKAYTYDTYMCPEPHEEYPLEGPGVNHAQLILDHLTLARAEFLKRRQQRLSMELALESCKELENMGNWQHIVELLTPLWRDMSFRTEGWWDITEAISWTLRKAAAQTSHKELLVAIDWELMNRAFSRRPGWHYDISRSLEGLHMTQPPVINLDDEHLTSFVSADFVFKSGEGKAGQICPAQLTLVSSAFHDAAPVTFKSLRIHVEGGLREISLKHDGTLGATQGSASLEVVKVSLREIDSTGDEGADYESGGGAQDGSSIHLEGVQDLTLSPGQTRVFEFDIPLREPGDARVKSIEACLDSDAFTLTYSMKPHRTESTSQWHRGATSRKAVMRSDPRSIKILPRPPKMRIASLKMLDQYYANESIQFQLRVTNEEDADASAKLDLNLRGAGAPSYLIEVLGEGSHHSHSSGASSRDIPLGTIRASNLSTVLVTLEPTDGPTILDLDVKVSYFLVSDPSTPIVQETAYQLNVVSPFEANYDLLPRIHTEWPSLFNAENIQDLPGDGSGDAALLRPKGLAQRWALITRYCSFAHEDVLVSDLELDVISTEGNIVCTASKAETLPSEGKVLSPKVIEEGRFDLVSQKLSLDDRSPATADLAFIIKWRRASAPKTVVNVTTLPLPRYFVTVCEPRVLATVSYSSSHPTSSEDPTTTPTTSSSAGPQLVFLDVTIENPSSHFLTFGLTMEPSDEFAFSGSKTTTINVLPVARRSTTYRLLPLTRGAWIRPTLVVRDKYFQKVLKIIPTEGMKADKDGVLVWVPPDEEEEEEEEEEA